jgi:ABC-type Na+ efflux pump permease subunit
MEKEMRTRTEQLGTTIRIIWAIAAKDILEGIRSKTILSAVIAMVFLTAYDTVMPSIRSGNSPPPVVVWDTEGSDLVDQLEESDGIEVTLVSSQQELEHLLGSSFEATMGLVIPPGFDQEVEAEQIGLEGYVDRWVTDSIAEKTLSTVEAELSALIGRPVQINLETDTVFTERNGGQSWSASMAAVLMISMFGMFATPALMLSEKFTKTMDALMVSPATATQIVLGKAIAGLFYCFAAAAFVLVFRSALVVHWGITIIAVIIGSLFSVSVGLLLGSATSTRQQTMIWTYILFFPSAISVVASDMLSRTDLPANLQIVRDIVALVPTAALAKVFRVSFARDGAWTDVGLELALIGGFTIAILAVVAWVIRRSDR